MSSFLVFDTETTGLPKYSTLTKNNYNDWPYPVQISWIDEKNKEYSFTIKPDDYTIPEESIKIHGITNEIANQTGFDIKDVLLEFKKSCENVQFLVAHNATFDINIITATCYRYKIDTSFLKNKTIICTMKSTTNLCKLPFSNNSVRYKYPKLEELYMFLFNKKPDGTLHNSLDDSRITLLCFKKLQEMRKNLMLN